MIGRRLSVQAARGRGEESKELPRIHSINVENGKRVFPLRNKNISSFLPFPVLFPMPDSFSLPNALSHFIIITVSGAHSIITTLYEGALRDRLIQSLAKGAV